jgi:hypothetical protein
MRFSLRWLFLITTYTAILTAGVVIGRSWPPGLMVMILVAILVSHIHRSRRRQSPEAAAWFKAIAVGDKVRAIVKSTDVMIDK